MTLIAFCFPSSFVRGLTWTLLVYVWGFLEPSFTRRENKETNKLYNKTFLGLTLHPKVAIEIHQMQTLWGLEANLTGNAGKLEAMKDIDLLNILSVHMCVCVCVFSNPLREIYTNPYRCTPFCLLFPTV